MKKLLCIIAGITIVLLLPSIVFAQLRTITGKITDSKNNPVPNATITVKKSSQATVTDAEGKFKVNVPENAVLVISSIGFTSQTITAGNTNELAIKLTEDVARLDEVVVTGLATTVKRRNLANAVSTISARELNGVAPAQTFDAALEGKIPGAYINANSGAPGGGISVKLRGVTSVYGNTQPLYVVDGVYMDNTATSGGLNTVTLALRDGSATSNQDNPSSRIADLRAED